MSGFTNHSAAKYDLDHNELKAVDRHEGRRPKLAGPVSLVGPFRHKSVHSFFSRTSSVGPMMDRVISVVAYRNSSTDADKVNPKVKVKDKANVKVKAKQSDRDKSSAGDQSAAQLQLVSRFFLTITFVQQIYRFQPMHIPSLCSVCLYFLNCLYYALEALLGDRDD